tara:strand:+ start:283 stop:1140 length:858 start_codon:yes stop_codon:yes gene_type:complete
MRKSNYLFILTAASLLSTASFAFVNNKLGCHAPIYCPQSVVCSNDGRLDSCKPIGGNQEYWNVDEMIEDGRVSKAEYTFFNAASSYQTPIPNRMYANCQYLLKTPSGLKMITLNSKKSLTYIEGSFDDSKYWKINGYNADCQGESPGLCPFIEPGLYVNQVAKLQPNNNTLYLKVKLSANGIVIKENDNPVTGGGPWIFINYDEALSACGGVLQCKIDVSIDRFDSGQNQYHIVAGSVIVDMAKDMRIVSVNASPCSGYTMKQVTPFNTIMFEKANQNATLNNCS